jgi:N-acetylmuramic acid 6-phosphate etherase
MTTQSVFPTELQNPATSDIDRVSVTEALTLINQQDQAVPLAVAVAIPAMARLIEAAVPVLAAGGSLVYLGAGTSGRLAVLDAAECPPTFSALPHQVQALIAGGEAAMVNAIEGAEDDGPAGVCDLQAVINQSSVLPVVVGVSASGAAAYVSEALKSAKAAGCVTGSITCNPTGALNGVAYVDYPVVVDVGPEVIAGSTRMKAGTAQKLLLNMLSTTCMVQLGKTYGNWMIDVRPTNHKLRQRAIRLVTTLGQVNATEAEQLLQQTGGQVKPAVVMARKQCDVMQAANLLAKANQRLRQVIG